MYHHQTLLSINIKPLNYSFEDLEKFRYLVKKNNLNCLTFQDGTDRLYRNVDKHYQPTLRELPQEQRPQTTPRRKPKISNRITNKITATQKLNTCIFRGRLATIHCIIRIFPSPISNQKVDYTKHIFNFCSAYVWVCVRVCNSPSQPRREAWTEGKYMNIWA